LTPATNGEKYRALENTFIATKDRKRVLPLGAEITVLEIVDGQALIIDDRDIKGWIPMQNSKGGATIEMIPPEITEPPPDLDLTTGLSQKQSDDSPKTLRKTVKKVGDKIARGVEKSVGKLVQNVEDVADKSVANLSKATGINFAPVKIPLKRRRQTCGVLMFIFLLPAVVCINLCCLFYLPSILWYLYIGFVGYSIFFMDIQQKGGFPLEPIRNLFFWRWFCEFFPITTHKTAELDPKEKFIFGYHPHGIISMGAFGTFALYHPGGFQDTYPDIDIRLLTLDINFRVPILNLLLISLGICNASKKSILSHLRKGPGRGVVLVLGGAKESLDAHPGKATLYLQNRKGFVKIALREGATLVPVYGFGENELFSQMNNPLGSKLRGWQDWLQTKFGFALPFFYGRGVFQYDYGMLPRRKPIDVYFGEPVKCPKVEESKLGEVLDEYHQKYITSLTNLYDKYKDHHLRHAESLKFR